VDVFGVDMLHEKMGSKRLGAIGVTAVPCILICRVGHQVGRIFPERENPAVAQQMVEYWRGIRARAGAPDEREIPAMRKEKEDKERYRQQVKNRIAEDRVDMLARRRRTPDEGT
jgi:hypothetical protein